MTVKTDKKPLQWHQTPDLVWNTYGKKKGRRGEVKKISIMSVGEETPWSLNYSICLDSKACFKKSPLHKWKEKVSTLILLNVLSNSLPILSFFLYFFFLSLSSFPAHFPFHLSSLSSSPTTSHFSLLFFTFWETYFIFCRRLRNITNSRKIYWYKLTNLPDITCATLLLNNNEIYPSPEYSLWKYVCLCITYL